MNEPAPTQPAPAAAPPPVAFATNPAGTQISAQWAHDAPLLGCRFDPQGRFAFAGSENRMLVRWDAASGQRVTMPGHESWLRGLAFSPDGQTVITAGYDGRLIWWPVAEPQPQPLRKIDAHKGWARSIAITPDGTLLATGGDDRVVKLWNATDGSPVRETPLHESTVYTTAFDLAGRFVFTGERHGKAHQWDAGTGQLVKSFDAAKLYTFDKTFRSHFGGVRAMAVSPDGKLLACGGLHENTNAFAGEHKLLVLVFDTETGQLARQHIADLRGFVSDLKFHPDGYLIGSSSGAVGGAVLFWKEGQESEFHRLPIPPVVRGLDLHPDGSRLALACADHHLRLAAIPPATPPAAG